jgi:pSer/pThr/pTyr-binding forkhead associated (FHA) protein
MPSNRPTRTARAIRPVGKLDEPARGFEIVVMIGPDLGKVFPLEKSFVRVGSGPGNDIALSDETVSHSHCILEKTERGHRIRDLGSTNGTKVDGVIVVEAYVNPGAQVVVGETTLRFQKSRA